METQAIYNITHIATGRIYIGSSSDVHSRWATHKNQLRKKKHCNTKLQNGWNKYGEDAFLFGVTEIVSDRSTLFDREQFWIDTLQPHYNMKAVAAGRGYGWTHTPETRQRMSEMRTGYKMDLATVQKGVKTRAERYVPVRETRPCSYCRKPITRKPGQFRYAYSYCDILCYQAENNDKQQAKPKNIIVTSICKNPRCRKLFTKSGAAKRKVYCSRLCNNQGKRALRPRSGLMTTCIFCGKQVGRKSPVQKTCLGIDCQKRLGEERKAKKRYVLPV